jgi:hypothetical protein
MCKSERANYQKLTMKAEKPGATGRGEGEETKLYKKFWQLSGAETKSTVKADSVVARELLERFQREAERDGIIRFPDFATNFEHGLLTSAKGSHAFAI